MLHRVFNLKTAAVVCRQLDCGSVITMERTESPIYRSTRKAELAWAITSLCDGSESSLRECGIMKSRPGYWILEVNCSGNIMTIS